MQPRGRAKLNRAGNRHAWAPSGPLATRFCKPALLPVKDALDTLQANSISRVMSLT